MDKKKVMYTICNIIQFIAIVVFFIIYLVIAGEKEVTLGTVIGLLIIQVLLETLCLLIASVKIAIEGMGILDIVQVILFTIAIATVCWSLWNCINAIIYALDTYEQVLDLYKMAQTMII